MPDALVSAGAVPVPQAARIGPNAIIQLVAAVRAALGGQAAADLLAAAGLSGYRTALPDSMVPEAEVIRLHRAAVARFGATGAASLAREAGRLTGDYLLAHRIPKAAQFVLKRLPAPLASRILLGAVAKHAWTFAGSGTFAVERAAPAVVTIADSPMCRGRRDGVPVCDFYTGTFERLYRVLVHPAALARETACTAAGDPICRFEITW